MERNPSDSNHKYRGFPWKPFTKWIDGERNPSESNHIYRGFPCKPSTKSIDGEKPIKE
jgi:hypothetical protein